MKQKNETKKINLFTSVNAFLAIFCACSALMNYVGVNIENESSATSVLGENTFEYRLSEQSLSLMKNGKQVGLIPTEKQLVFTSGVNFNCNAIGVGIAALAGKRSGQDVINAGLEGAVSGGAACAVVPGAACVEATLGGAGAVAAEAALDVAAVTAGAVFAPILVGAAIVGGVC